MTVDIIHQVRRLTFSIESRWSDVELVLVQALSMVLNLSTPCLPKAKSSLWSTALQVQVQVVNKSSRRYTSTSKRQTFKHHSVKSLLSLSLFEVLIQLMYVLTEFI